MSSEEAGITSDDIKAFRVGSFDSATKNIKAKWYMVMLKLLPCVCGKYTKLVKASTLAKDFTTTSDEALVLWHLLLYGPTWEEEAKEEQENREGAEKRKGKPKGDHYSRTQINLFYETFTQVWEARNAASTGKDWDEAVRDEAKRQNQKGKRMYKLVGDSKDASDEAKPTFVVKFSPGKKMRVFRSSEPTLYAV